MLPNHPSEMGNNTILQRFLCSLGNHLILPVVCQFFLVLENFMPRKGYSFRELSALTAGGSALPAVPGWHRGTPGCALWLAAQANVHPSECPSLLPLLTLLPDVVGLCVSGAASLGGDEKRVMHRGDMLNFPQRWCSHNNISPTDGVHVSLPFHWSCVPRRDMEGACVPLLFPEPALPFWGGRGAWPSVVSLRKTLSQ